MESTESASSTSTNSTSTSTSTSSTKSKKTSIRSPRSLINYLPDEILIEIFSYISAEDLAINVKNVCTRWAEASQVSSIWENKTYEASKDTNVELFYKVIKHAPKLKYLKIRNLHRFGWVEMEHLLKTYGSMIKSMNLSWKDVNKLPLVVKFCRNLEILRICGKTWGMGIIPYCLNALKDAPNLVTLETPYVFRYPYHDFTDLFQSANFCKLVNLDMSYGTYVSRGMLEAIFRKCIKLKVLSLKYCVNIMDTSLEFIHLLQYLEYLNLKGCNCLTDIATKHIVRCTTLTYLNMDYCHKLTSRSVQLCHWWLKQLRELHANCRPISEEDL